ncbi:MAG: DinB family protein [Gemmatimonadales bacterium]|nr:DinB family protein [Gemmatimonadales bacterium]
MRKTLALAAVLAALPVTASAQGMAAIKPLYEDFRGWLIASAQQMPEADYSFKPTPEVRSFGELLGHTANANFMFCSAALGEESPSKQDYEKAATKAEIVQGIEAAFAYCDKAYAMPDAKAMEEITFFRRKGTRLWVLNFNATHDAEHYGNVVTYMRLKGMVPPSSQRGGM